jgi:hypothetical protein
MQRYIVAAAAGVIATGAMTIAMNGLRQRHSLSKRQLPPRRIVANVARRMLATAPPRGAHMTATANAAHYAYGGAMGALYQAVVPAQRRGLASGALFGLAVWTASYCGWLPLLRLHASPLVDPRSRSEVMILAHLVWGAALGLLSKRC